MKERIVVKVGTSTLTSEQGKIDLRSMKHLAWVLSDIMEKEHKK
jgi:glutamate 5-kinase